MRRRGHSSLPVPVHGLVHFRTIFDRLALCGKQTHGSASYINIFDSALVGGKKSPGQTKTFVTPKAASNT